MSSSSKPQITPPEEGDYLINWNTQYINGLLLQGESWANTLIDQIRAELTKMKADNEFIKNNLPGSHTHLQRLKAHDQDLRRVVQSAREIADLLRATARRVEQRLIQS